MSNMNQPTPTITCTRNIGSNRGKTRLWIEGAVLSTMGWNKGRSFNAEFQPYGPEDKVLVYVAQDEATDTAKRRVAGTPDRPIIDTNTDKLRDCLGVEVGDKVHITITVLMITVEKFDPAQHGTEHATDGKRQSV